jgi:hypothetical protein
MKKRRQSLRTAVAACARCVITEHLADRRKSPVWSTEATYLLGSTAGVPEERSATRGPDLRWSASLNRHKIWLDCGNGHCEGSLFGLKTENALPGGGNDTYRGMYLELRQRPVSREHARSQPPRPAAAGTEEGQRSQQPAPGEPVPVGVTGHRTKRPRGQVGRPPDPGPHPEQPSPAAQLPLGPRGRTVANTAAPGSFDRAAGPLYGAHTCTTCTWAGGGAVRLPHQSPLRPNKPIVE